MERLKEELIELRDADLGPCGFGLLTILGDSGVRLPHPAGWQFLEQRVDFDTQDGIIRLRPDPWFDPAPGGGSCVRWWGNVERVRRFRDWSDRASVVCRKDRTVGIGSDVGPGYHGLLPSLVRFAKATPDLSKSVQTKVVFDTGTVPAARQARLPSGLRSLETAAVFSFDAVQSWAERFAERVIDRLLRGPRRGPRLVVDIDAPSVTLDGKTQYPGEVVVNILHELVEAGGRTISSGDMRKNRFLKEQQRLDRDIAGIRRKLKIDIISVPKKGYFLPDEYLA
ncbi:hypothetical protein J0H58_12595 [bacterium]|nr:hypothetical protein [bacterium]